MHAIISATRSSLATTVLIILASTATAIAEQHDALALFDGRSLEGWEGDQQFWRLEDGVLIGETTAERPTKNNTFLVYTEQEFGDFDLRFSYRVRGGNSGVQYRSELLSEWVVKGLQSDFEDKIHDGKDTFTGMFFEEKGRMFLGQRGQAVIVRGNPQQPNKPRIEVVGSVGAPAELETVIKRDDWNEMRVIARGFTFLHIVNGRVMSVGIDQDATNRKTSGLIAFQLHAGPPMQIQIKDVTLTPLGDH